MRSLSTIVASKKEENGASLVDLRDDIIEEEIESGANFGEVVKD